MDREHGGLESACASGMQRIPLPHAAQVAIEGEGVGKIRIAPVLIEKGATRVALYGLGNLRDERLGRLFQTPACVQWCVLGPPCFLLCMQLACQGPTAESMP